MTRLFCDRRLFHPILFKPKKLEPILVFRKIKKERNCRLDKWQVGQIAGGQLTGRTNGRSDKWRISFIGWTNDVFYIGRTNCGSDCWTNWGSHFWKNLRHPSSAVQMEMAVLRKPKHNTWQAVFWILAKLSTCCKMQFHDTRHTHHIYKTNFLKKSTVQVAIAYQ